METLRNFDQRYGWIAKWMWPIVIGVVVFFADGRYLTRTEVEAKEVRYHEMREKDIAMLNQEIQSVRQYSDTINTEINGLKMLLGRISAQNEMILNDLRGNRNKNPQ